MEEYYNSKNWRSSLEIKKTFQTQFRRFTLTLVSRSFFTIFLIQLEKKEREVWDKRRIKCNLYNSLSLKFNKKKIDLKEEGSWLTSNFSSQIQYITQQPGDENTKTHPWEAVICKKKTIFLTYLHAYVQQLEGRFNNLILGTHGLRETYLSLNTPTQCKTSCMTSKFFLRS